VVREQAEWKIIFLSELPVFLRAVVGHAEHLDPEVLELLPAVTQPGGLQRSTGG
jgi:hypothetical protein